MHLTDKVLHYLTEKQQASGGKCGTSPGSIRTDFTEDWEEIRHVLNNLYKQKLIKIRPGFHGNLIFLTRYGTAENT